MTLIPRFHRIQWIQLGRTNGRTDERMDGWIDEWMDGRTDWNEGKSGKPKWGLNWVGIYLKETTRRIQVQDDEDEEQMKNSDAMCNQLVFVTTAEPLMSFSRCCCWWNCLFVFYCSYAVLVVVAVLVSLETMTRSEGQTILLPQLGMIVFRISQGNVWLKWYLRLFVVSKLGINGGMGEANTYYNNTTISQCGGNNSL